MLNALKSIPPADGAALQSLTVGIPNRRRSAIWGWGLSCPWLLSHRLWSRPKAYRRMLAIPTYLVTFAANLSSSSAVPSTVASVKSMCRVLRWRIPLCGTRASRLPPFTSVPIKAMQIRLQHQHQHQHPARRFRRRARSSIATTTTSSPWSTSTSRYGISRRRSDGSNTAAAAWPMQPRKWPS